MAAIDPLNFPSEFRLAKVDKLRRIDQFIRRSELVSENKNSFNFLDNSIIAELALDPTDNVSQHPYDNHALALIKKHEGGLILDCGAGRRPLYYDNVVNLEIVDYETTDVRAANELLPFNDNTFDAVFSLNVLEHVRFPNKSAEEICRVLKPGGDLYCVVPLLQPVHGYPHHYFNMTSEGLKSLFEGEITDIRQTVLRSGHPLMTLYWILAIWRDRLDEESALIFEKLTVKELCEDPSTLLDEIWASRLSEDAQFILASTTALFGTKN